MAMRGGWKRWVLLFALSVETGSGWTQTSPGGAPAVLRPGQPPAGAYRTPSAAPSSAEGDLAQRVETQKSVREQVDQAARRLETMMRVLRYQKLDSHGEHQLLDEARIILKGLSEKEMAEVVARLDRARKEPTAATSETDRAFQVHLVIMSRLRELSLRRDAVRSLAEAAARARKAARDQGRLHGSIAGEIAGATAPRQSTREAMVRIGQTVDAQRDLNTEVSLLLRQAAALESSLDPKHKEKLLKGLGEAKNANLIDRLNRIPTQIATEGVSQDRGGRLRPALEDTRQAAETLLNVARAWREEEPETAALKRIDERAALVQENLREARDKGGAQSASEEDRREAQEAQAEATRELKDLAREAQEKAPEAAMAFRDSGDHLRAAQEKTLNNDLNAARPLEERARDELARARQKLDEVLEKKEKDKASKKEAEHKSRLDRLAANQKSLNEKTMRASKQPKNGESESLAREQAQLAAEALDLARTAQSPDEAKALAEAGKSLTEATRDLADKQSPDDNAAQALPDQEKGLANLEAAKKELAKANEKRDKEDLVRRKREKAAKLLTDAARKQEEMARKAGELDQDRQLQGQAARDLATAEEKLKSQVGEAMNELTGDKESAQARAEAGEAMRELAETVQDLKAAKPADAARDARQAADALADAARLANNLVEQDQAAKALEDAQRNDELGLIPEASRRIEKALEDARKAKTLANQAQEALKSNPTADLARAQGKLAAQLKENAETEGAAADAQKAADSLRQGDLSAALKDQKAALDRLQAQSDKSPQARTGAQEQNRLLEAARALEQSGQAAAQAETGTEQAEGLVPGGLLPALDKAEEALRAGEKAAMRGDAREAATRQTEAVERLEKALGQLKLLSKMAEGKQQPQLDPFDLVKADPNAKPPNPMDPPPTQNQPSDKPSTGKSDGKSQDKTPQTGKMEPSQLMDAEGVGRFLRLPAREREALLQAWTEGLPPSYAAMVQKYFRDLARTADGAPKPGNMP